MRKGEGESRVVGWASWNVRSGSLKLSLQGGGRLERARHIGNGWPPPVPVGLGPLTLPRRPRPRSRRRTSLLTAPTGCPNSQKDLRRPNHTASKARVGSVRPVTRGRRQTRSHQGGICRGSGGEFLAVLGAPQSERTNDLHSFRVSQAAAASDQPKCRPRAHFCLLFFPLNESESEATSTM